MGSQMDSRRSGQQKDQQTDSKQIVNGQQTGGKRIAEEWGRKRTADGQQMDSKRIAEGLGGKRISRRIANGWQKDKFVDLFFWHPFKNLFAIRSLSFCDHNHSGFSALGKNTARRLSIQPEQFSGDWRTWMEKLDSAPIGLITYGLAFHRQYTKVLR